MRSSPSYPVLIVPAPVATPLCVPSRALASCKQLRQTVGLSKPEGKPCRHLSQTASKQAEERSVSLGSLCEATEATVTQNNAKKTHQTKWLQVQSDLHRSSRRSGS